MSTIRSLDRDRDRFNIEFALDTAKPLLLLIDGHYLAYRIFYGYNKHGKGGPASKHGRPTTLTYGFLIWLLSTVKTLKPQGVAIAFDTDNPTFRHKADVNYKADRDKPPDVFYQDLHQLQAILREQLNLPLCMAPGFEADDVLGTLANRAANNGWSVRILSGDLDLFQLVDDSRDIAVLYTAPRSNPRSRGSALIPTLIDEKGVVGKLGVMPNKIVDLTALMGDRSDNIPGVFGVGPKKAINLLEENEDLDGVYASLAEVEAEGPTACRGAIKGVLKGQLAKDRDKAYLSRTLAEILVDIPLPEEPQLPLTCVDATGLTSRLKELGLDRLLRKVRSFQAAFSEGGDAANAAMDCRPTRKRGSRWARR